MSNPADKPPTLLLLALSSNTLPALKMHLASALHAHSIKAIHLLSPHAPLLEDLKLHSYTLAGQLARNVAVTRHTLPSDLDLAALSSTLETATEGADVRGVLLALPTPSQQRAFLDVDFSVLEDVFRSTVGVVHAVARVTVPGLITARDGFFAFVDGERTDGVAGALRGVAVAEVRRAVGMAGEVQVGEAEDVLPPPKVEEKRVEEGNGLPVEGIRRLRVDMPPTNGFDVDDFDPGESPTKLWAEWALQEEELG
ncbi:hypothetical protein K461DRAFT_271830 [Myriangium duriaei CBS 260.36]|uniref:NAD(P)-binding domain-containing protein n=1 Tax=Myriangium duriaei CBS 260.36 TaxID=1168546 RepID=A0A9P4IRE3_9PEZI|nr:hypothetical protein K461DRAFT_271830 [Myriangium duriaei CBS 260.36]